MQQAFAPLVPMLIGAGVFKVGIELIDAAVSNRLLRGVLLIAATAAWATWHFNYIATALVK